MSLLYASVCLALFTNAVVGSNVSAILADSCDCKNGLETLSYVGDTLTIKSPNYPSDYCKNLQCRWHIHSPLNSVIEIDFSSTFNTEAVYDKVEVYSGSTEFGKFLESCSGNIICPTVTSSGRDMYITFETDGSGERSGFTSTATAKTQSCDCDSGTKTLSYVGRSLTIKSPNYPSDYCNNLQCYWHIHSPLNSVVEIDFSSTFHTEATDHVKVYSGSSESGTLLESCSGDILCDTVTSSGRDMYITFDTDSSTTERGFTSTVTAKACECNSRTVFLTYDYDSEYITSPNYDDDYCANMDCHYTVKAPTGDYVQLWFYDCNLDSSSTLEIFDGASDSADRLATYTGSSYYCSSVESSGQYIYIKFTSGSSAGGKFKITAESFVIIGFMSTGVIVGIVLACLGFTVAMIVVIVWVIRRNRFRHHQPAVITAQPVMGYTVAPQPYTVVTQPPPVYVQPAAQPPPAYIQPQAATTESARM